MPVQAVNSVQKKEQSTDWSKPQWQSEPAMFDYSNTPWSEYKLSSAKSYYLSDEIKGLMLDSTKVMGIKPYAQAVLKNNHIAIAASQKHLYDLMKYYEGDRTYYYDAITKNYKDKFGSKTSGFGQLTAGNLTRKQAYEKMCSMLASSSREIKNLLNKKIGNGVYEALPNSIKEGLIDLCYNKGLGKISNNAKLMEAIKNKDYSTVVANLVYVYSGKSDAEKKPDPGLYRRSLSRAILALRDLKGTERTQAKAEIDKIYQRAKKCFEENRVSTKELDDIYSQYKTGKINGTPISAEAYLFKIDESFKGQGLKSIAKRIYEGYQNPKISFDDFYSKFLKINGNPEVISIGQEVKLPVLEGTSFKGVSKGQVTKPTAKQKENHQAAEETKEKEPFLKRMAKGVISFFKKLGQSIKSHIDNSLAVLSEDAEGVKTPFQRLLEEDGVEMVSEGDFEIITKEHELEEGETLTSLAKEYGTSIDILCNDNKISEAQRKNIKQGDKITVRKLGYKIKQGDTLTQIAKKFGLTVEILKDINNIEDVDVIKTDQIIEIPGFIHNVNKKETLSSIAREVGVSVQTLMQINNLKTDKINPGDRIKIIYNDSDFSVSADKKKVSVDAKTKIKTETIDMSGKANFSHRPLLRKKQKVNGQVVATRKVFEPTAVGPLSKPQRTIIVNAGHGYSQAGVDTGTLGKGGLEDEWLINYDNAMKLVSKLRAQGARVIFLQGHVNLITAELRKPRNKADMFISVHVNANQSLTQDRTQIYYSTQDKLAVNKKSRYLAEKMEENFDKWIPKHERILPKDKFTIKGKQDYAQSMSANYAVLRNGETARNIPSVLWEVGYMISPKGRERLSSTYIMNNYADLMAKSVVEAFKNDFKS